MGTELPQRPTPRRSPFAATVPSVVASLGFAVATVVWVVAGADLPGGRWLAVHLFTLGVLTNLVWAFSRHFAQRLTTLPERDRLRLPLVLLLNVGVVVTLVGVAGGHVVAVGAGSTAVTGVVLAGWWHLRRRRAAAPEARFAWVVRIYERAHGAFVHGAVLGALLGVGVLPGSWFLSARDAHLHVMVLGWGGLTLVATLVFFGPALLRTRMEAGADERAAGALRRAATALTVAVVAMLLTGVGGTAATVLSLAAAAGLVVVLVGVLAVTGPVLRAAAAAKPYLARGPVMGVAVWLPVAVAIDVVAVAAGQRSWLEAAGVVLLVGALGQAVLVVLVFITPTLRGATFAARERWLARTSRLAGPRTFVLNVGVALVGIATALGTTAGPGGTVVVRAGWSAVALGVAAHLLVVLWPVRDAGLDTSRAVADRRGRRSGQGS